MDFVQKTITDYNGLASDVVCQPQNDEVSGILLKALNSYSYVVDYCTGGYVYLSDSFKDVVNFPVQLIRKEGIRSYIRLIQKDDWKIINESVFPDICSFLAVAPNREDIKYRFIFNYRILRPDGSTIPIRQINNYLKLDKNGRPLVNAGVCTAIPYPIPNHKITFLIQSQNKHQTWENEDVKSFIPDQVFANKLSPSELNVLHWIKNGYNSEKIAQKLNRSLHTIKTHRKNMLEKTQCRNTIELLQYSLMHGLI